MATDKKATAFRFDSNLLKKAKDMAVQDRRSLNSFIEILVENEFEKRKSKAP